MNSNREVGPLSHQEARYQVHKAVTDAKRHIRQALDHLTLANALMGAPPESHAFHHRDAVDIEQAAHLVAVVACLVEAVSLAPPGPLKREEFFAPFVTDGGR